MSVENRSMYDRTIHTSNIISGQMLYTDLQYIFLDYDKQ